MDAANAILIGALDACAMGKYEADPSGAELLRTQLTEVGGDGAASPTDGRRVVVSREVEVHAEIDPSLDAGMRAARAEAARDAEAARARDLEEQTTAEQNSLERAAVVAEHRAAVEKEEAAERAKEAAAVEKMQALLNQSKVQTAEARVKGLVGVGEENAVAEKIAAKMLAIQRAKGKDVRPASAPVVPPPPSDPYPASEGWL